MFDVHAWCPAATCSRLGLQPHAEQRLGHWTLDRLFMAPPMKTSPARSSFWLLMLLLTTALFGAGCASMPEEDKNFFLRGWIDPNSK
jgi:hypothetical protein